MPEIDPFHSSDSSRNFRITHPRYWDGGMGKDAKLLMTDADLNDPSAMTVTVFPLSGLRGATIAPLSRDVVSLPTRYGDVSLSNLVRMWDVSAPRGSSSMEAYVAEGRADAARWLKADGFSAG